MQIKRKAAISLLVMLCVAFHVMPCFAAAAGDVDNNSSVDLKDVILSLKVVAGGQNSVTVTSGNDVNADGRIGIQEAIYDMRHLAGLSVDNQEFVQFAPGYFEQPYLTPLIKHPRPSTETNSYAISRRWHPGVPWEIPVCVSGLSWPMYFEVSGPEGMYFVESFPVVNEQTGEYVLGDKYGYLRWRNPTVGLHPYTITIRGQNGRQLEVSSVLTVTTEGVYFVAEDGDDAASGRINSPKRSIEAYFGGGFEDATIIVRGGTYAPSSLLRISEGSPKNILGYVGEQVNVDMTASVIPMDTGSDISIGRINFKNSNAELSTARIIYGTTNWSDGHRFLGFELSFDGFTPGIVGNENPGNIVVLAPAVYRDYFCLSNITITNTVNGIAMGALYQLRKSFIDNVKLGQGINCDKGIFLKAGCRDFSIYRVVQSTDINYKNGPVSIGLGIDGDGLLQNDMIEIAFCRIKSDNWSDHYALRYQGAVTDPGNPRVYIYRNNLYGRVGYGGSIGTASIVNIMRNVVQSKSSSPIQPGTKIITVIETDNLIGNESAGYLDEYINISGDALATFAGLRGANLYSRP